MPKPSQWPRSSTPWKVRTRLKLQSLYPLSAHSALKTSSMRLAGMDLVGQLEVSYQAYDYVAKMLVADVPMYLEPHRFTTRASEIARDKPPKTLVVESSTLQVKDKERKDRCHIVNELQLSQALTRRSLACDLMGVCSFKVMERWHRYLFDQMQLPPPPHFRAPTLEQIVRTDKMAWLRMAETVDTLKIQPDGTKPLDAAIDTLRSDHTVTFHMLPMPGKSSPDDRKSDDKKRKQVDSDFEPRKRGKGKGKGKSKGKSPAMPSALTQPGLKSNLEDGSRICWNFNLSKGCQFAAAGGRCARGVHKCMKCLKDHSLTKCKDE